jgi:hypothetical protein
LMESMVATAREGGEASCEGTAISFVIVTEMRHDGRGLELARDAIFG